jgi:hypothetical protein
MAKQKYMTSYDRKGSVNFILPRRLTRFTRTGGWRGWLELLIGLSIPHVLKPLIHLWHAGT